jgi:alcohol dehydrogenase (NADP+)
MSKCKGYTALTAKAPLAPCSFRRREPRDHDVVIDITYCGICHSDIHQTRDQWRDYQEESIFPMVPGHEIGGVVTVTGKKVHEI